MSRVSKKKAMLFFQDRALPRRTRDTKAEELYYKKTKRHVNIYRRVGPDEHDRGELYPVIHSGMDTFAHFGVGIGIYFAQLVILTCVTFLCGMVMLAAVNEYQDPSYGASSKLPFSAACEAKNVTATINCPNGEESCERLYRSCALPYNAAAADIAMCIIFCLAIIFSKYIEAKIEQKLDESVQTAKDYSVQVLDPDGNADDPNRWYEHFSQFGEVKYITILRRNNELTDLILKKHNVVRKIQESGRMSSKRKTDDLHRQYEKIEEEINRALKKQYPVCKVFVTFDSEKDQHQCLNELEVPDYEALFDLKSKTAKSSYVFGDNVLDVRQPPEPDNILWQNLAVGKFQSRLRNAQAFLFYIGILAVVWYLVKAVRDNIPNLLGLLVGIVDSVLPTIFDYLTDYQHPRSEGSKQTSLQTRLFCARFLLSTIIPYLTADWDAALTPEFIGQILTVQIAACFTAPLMDLTDWYGLFMRHYYSGMVADTQEEMNSFWVGSYWSIAEKYTGIAKVVFVSLFYALLTPISLLIATVAFIVIFLIDNYLLLRRWKVASMLDSTIASRLRRQAILSICAHMFVTMRFIYSWPMDQVYWNGNAFEVVDKAPPYNFLTIKVQPWMGEGQKHIFYSYKILLILVCLTTLHILILQPFGQWLFTFLCKSIRVAGEMDSMKFSSVESIRIYYPMLRNQEEQYLCSYAKNVLPRHRPVLIDSNNIMKDDLSVYVPVELQKKVLSIVQYFGVDPIEQFEEKKIIDLDDLQTLATKTLPKPKSKKVLAVGMKDSMSAAWYRFRLSLWQQQDYFYFRWAGRHLTKPQYLLEEPPRLGQTFRHNYNNYIVPTSESPTDFLFRDEDEDLENGDGSNKNSRPRNSRSPTPTKELRALLRKNGVDLTRESPHLNNDTTTNEESASNKEDQASSTAIVTVDEKAIDSKITPTALAAVKAFRSVASPTSNRPSPVSSPGVVALRNAMLQARSSNSSRSLSIVSSPTSALSPAAAGADGKPKTFFAQPGTHEVAERKSPGLEDAQEGKHDHLVLSGQPRFPMIVEEEPEMESGKGSPKRNSSGHPSFSAVATANNVDQPPPINSLISALAALDTTAGKETASSISHDNDSKSLMKPISPVSSNAHQTPSKSSLATNDNTAFVPVLFPKPTQATSSPHNAAISSPKEVKAPVSPAGTPLVSVPMLNLTHTDVKKNTEESEAKNLSHLLNEAADVHASIEPLALKPSHSPDMTKSHSKPNEAASREHDESADDLSSLPLLESIEGLSPIKESLDLSQLASKQDEKQNGEDIDLTFDGE